MSERSPMDRYGPSLRARMCWAHWLVRPIRSWRHNTVYTRRHRQSVDAARGLMREGIRELSEGGVDAVVRLLSRFEYRPDHPRRDYEQSILAMHVRAVRENGLLIGDCEDAAVLAAWAFLCAGIDARVVYLYGRDLAHAVCITTDGVYVACNGRITCLQHGIEVIGSLGLRLANLISPTAKLLYTYPHYSLVASWAHRQEDT